MTSPAERYAESKRRAARAAEFPALDDFMLDVGFDLDDFQRQASEALERGSGVVVSEHRPVPLWQHMLVGRRMFDLFHDADAARKHDVHPELLRYTREMQRRLDMGDRAAGPAWNARGGRNRRWQ